MSIHDIERRRRKIGVSVGKLVAEARMRRETWRDAHAHPETTRRSTLERLARALDRLDVGERSQSAPAAIATLYELAAGLFAEKAGVDVAAVLAIVREFHVQKPNNELWLACARVRRLAIYLICGELRFSNADLAAAIGCTRQNVKQAVTAIEELREDPEIDALIASVVRLVPGRRS